MSLSISRSRAELGQGDPGLFGFLGKGIKKLGGAALDFSGLPNPFGGGGPGISQADLQKAAKRAARGQQIGPVKARLLSVQQGQGNINLPGGIGSINPPFGGSPGIGSQFPTLSPQQGQNGRPPAGMKLACPSGYHPNKSDYFTKSEGFIPEGTKCVKNRRRNPANPRALDRAVSRLNMAKRLQNKLRGFATDKYTRTGKKRDTC